MYDDESREVIEEQITLSQAVWETIKQEWGGWVLVGLLLPGAAVVYALDIAGLHSLAAVILILMSIVAFALASNFKSEVEMVRRRIRLK